MLTHIKKLLPKDIKERKGSEWKGTVKPRRTERNPHLAEERNQALGVTGRTKKKLQFQIPASCKNDVTS